LTPSLRDRALRALARRDHSRAELVRKLAPHGTSEEIADLLDQLTQAGLLSDARYVESFVHARTARFGAAKLRHSLREKGVSEALIAPALASEAASEAQRAEALWQRKYGVAPQDRNEYARQARFLQGRGFSAEIIGKVLRRITQAKLKDIEE